MRDRAAYMREYRAKKRGRLRDADVAMVVTTAEGLIRACHAERDRLTEEVARLKRELAERPADERRMWTPEFRPAPKPGKGK